MRGTKISAHTSMMNSVTWLDEESQTVRLCCGFSDEGRMNGNMDGFQAEVMYALDEDPVSSAGRHFGSRLTYDSGPLNLALTYGSTDVNAAGTKLKRQWSSSGVGLSLLCGRY